MSSKFVNVSRTAVAIAVIAMIHSTSVRAEDDEVAALTRPTNTVELGVTNVTQDSAKFGEYNGLNKAGSYLNGNVDLRGGNAYGGTEATGVRRWSVTGDNLGLSSRSMGATLSEQGEWSLGIGYDELKHNITDSYKTPYVGDSGGNSFRLPTGLSGVTDTSALTSTQLGLFRQMDIGSGRKNSSLNASKALDSRTTLNFDFNHLDQSGEKLSSFGMAGRAFSTTVNAGGESAATLPTPTNYKTDTLNLALNWRGDKSYWTVSYFGSFFREQNDRLTAVSFYTTPTAPVQTMSTAPSNSFNQLGFSGGYELTSATKLTGNASFGVNTQNDAFVVDSYLIEGTNKSSLNGHVANTHADLKLTNQYSKDLVLSAAAKYDLRDNQTKSDIYSFHSIGNTTAHNAIYPNTPLSNDKALVELAGDYKLQKDHYIRTTLENTNVSRWCSSYAVNTTYPAGTNCVVATHSQENKVGFTYRLKTDDDVAIKFGYSYSDRVTDSDPLAIAAFYSGKGLNAAGVVKPGYNGGDFVGFHPFFDGNRKQKLVKSSVNWQANEGLNLGVGAKLGHDSYETTYGVQDGTTWMLNFDADYAYSSNGTLSFYVTQQYRDRTMDNINAVATTTPTVADAKVWRNRLRDQDTTVGIAVKQGGLMSGRLQLVGDVAYTDAKTSYATAAISGVNPCTANNTCGDTPEITTTMQVVKLSGIYTLDKSSKVIVKVVHQQLANKDYYYNGYQVGIAPTTVMPTYQQAPNFSMNAVGVSLVHNY